MRRGTAIALAAIGAWSCAQPQAGAPQSQSAANAIVRLRGRDVTVHLTAGSVHTSGPLLVFTTGDGGWPDDPPLSLRMISWGYPIAVVSAPDWIATIEHQPGGSIEPSALADDYLKVIDAAIASLQLPAHTQAVIVGFSRGSGFIVAAATESRARARVQGLLAVALTGEEEYVARRGPGASATGEMIRTYESLPTIGALPVAVIQSAHDDFLPAAEARRRFGPDSPTRRFRAIDAPNHDFTGKQPELESEMKASLAWILGPHER